METSCMETSCKEPKLQYDIDIEYVYVNLTAVTVKMTTSLALTVVSFYLEIIQIHCMSY